MAKKQRVTLENYQTLLTHVADRFVDFYVIYNVARKYVPHKIAQLKQLNDRFKKAWERLELTEDDVNSLHITSEVWDRFQSNFSYDRILNPYLLTPYESIKHTRADGVIGDMYKDSIVSMEFEFIRRDFYHLYWIRAADIIQAPSPAQFHKKIEEALRYLSKIKGMHPNSKWENLPIDVSISPSPNNASSKTDLCHSLLFYPERLRPGVFYCYTDIKELQPNGTLAITCHFNADKDDIRDAFDEYPYHFEKFRNYFHTDHSDFTEIPEIEKLRPLIERSVRNNKHITQFNSIENTIIALIVWEMVHLEDKELLTAINDAVPVHFDSNKKSQIKKKLEEITGTIEKWKTYYDDMNEHGLVLDIPNNRHV